MPPPLSAATGQQVNDEAAMTDRAEEQRRLILDQFTRQAVPFAEMPAHSNDEANRLLIEMAGLGPVIRRAGMGFRGRGVRGTSGIAGPRLSGRPRTL